jgi:hypothetical protein
VLIPCRPGESSRQGWPIHQQRHDSDYVNANARPLALLLYPTSNNHMHSSCPVILVIGAGLFYCETLVGFFNSVADVGVLSSPRPATEY